MLTLDNLIIDIEAPGTQRPLWDYVTDVPLGVSLGTGMDIEAKPARILGAILFDPSVIGDNGDGDMADIISVTVTDREQFPMTGTARTRVAVDTDHKVMASHNLYEWRELHAIRPNDRIIIPVIFNDHRIGLVSAPVRTHKKAEMPDTLYRTSDNETKPKCLLASLRMLRAHSFATVSGVVACRDARDMS
jgi:hypothetical protein